MLCLFVVQKGSERSTPFAFVVHSHFSNDCSKQYRFIPAP